MNRFEICKKFSSFLEAEIQYVKLLLGHMEQEQIVLGSADHSSIEDMSNRKLQFVDRLKAFDEKGAKVLMEAGFAPDRAGVTACIEWCDFGNKIKDLWEEFTSLLARCRHLNQINQAIIETRRRHINQVLAILHGSIPGSQMYGPSGHVSEKSRTLYSMTRA
jgi:flagella synthesis protein FlgN